MKRLLLLLMVSIMALCSYAQGLRFGVEGGLNFSKPSSDDYFKTGFYLGGKGEYAFRSYDKGLYVSASLRLSSHPWKSDEALFETETPEINESGIYIYGSQ